MKFIIILGLFAYLEARLIEEKCDGIIVNNVNHVKEVLKDNVDSAYQLAINYDTDMLFFSYSYKDEDTFFKSAYINLKTNEFEIIEDIDGGFANGVDSATNTVYLGGSDGLYKLDVDMKHAKHIPETKHNIWQIFFKKKLYYTTFPYEHLYIYKDGEAKRVPELIDTTVTLVALDNNDNMYFANSSGFYIYEKAKNGVTLLGDYDLNAITSDKNGNIFFATASDIFSIDDNRKIEKLASIKSIYGMAVDKDGNIIYSSKNNIVRLKPTNTQCSVGI